MTSMKYAFGLFFILLVSALFAQGLDLCPSTATRDSQVMIIPTEDGKTITMTVLAFDINAPAPTISTSEQYKQWVEDCTGNPKFQECMYAHGLEANAHAGVQTITYESLKGAHVTVQYFNPMGNTYHGQWTNVRGCEDLPTDAEATGYKTDEYGNRVEYKYYTATCSLEKVAGNVNNTFRVIFTPDDATICPSVSEYDYENRDLTPATQFLAVVHNLVDRLSESSGAGPSLPCLGVFLILGLLLASLYFAGKSPVTLLDITTPRLPTPKGVTASGQILTPFGYGEMIKSTKDKMAKTTEALTVAAATMQKERHGDAELSNLKNAIGAQPTSFADRASNTVARDKAFAVSLVTAGRSVGLTAKEMAGLANKLPYHYGDAEHKTVARIIELLEKKGGKDALMAMTIRDYVNGQSTLKTLEVITAHPDIGKRSGAHYMLSNTLGKFYGSNRYAVLGGVVMAGTDSTFRSARVMGRMTKAIAAEAPGLGRGMAKSTMELLGGKRAMEDLKAKSKTSSAAAWVVGQLEKHPSTVVVGNMFPVNDKMAHLYKTLHKEAISDEMRYVMRQVYKKLGMNFNMSAEELAAMGHTDVDILNKAGHAASPQLAAVEAELRKILSNTVFTPTEKLAALMSLAETHGAYIDPAAVKFSQRLAAIEGSGEPEHVKLLSLQQLMEEQNKIRMAAGNGALRDDAFVCHVGGDSLRGNQVWETMVLRTMIWDGENGHLTGGIKEELLSARLNVVNRLSTLDPLSTAGNCHGASELPEHMRNTTQLKALTERNRNDLLQLFTEEGKAQYKQFTKGKNIESASIKEIVNFMYGGTLPRTYDIDPKTGKMMWWGTSMELALPKNATKVDVKRHWVAGLDPQENFAIGQWVESRFTKSYVPAFKASVEAELNRMPGSASWTNEQRTQAAKKIWVADQLAQDMEQRFNSHFGQNTYGTTRETTRFYGGIMAGFLEKTLQDKGLESNHPDLRFLQEMDSTNPKHLAKLKELMRTYANEYSSVISRDMTYDDIARSNKAVVMLHEGGYAYYKKGMMLSDMDRVMAGETALRDEKGQLRKFIPEEVPVRFAARDDLTAQYSKVRSSKDPNEWTTFVESATKWAKEGGYNYDRQKILAAVLWEYSNTTHDYSKFWKDSAVSVEAKRQVAPVAPASLRFFGVDGHSQSYILKPFRDIGLHWGDYISKVALAAGGPLHKASYDITPVSEAYRQHSLQTTMRIFQTLNNKEAAAQLTDAERVAYRAVAMQHSAYHQAWDYAIDRNPWRTSTSFGTHQAWSSFFHFGPAVPFQVRDNLRAYMDKGTYANFMAGYGFGMDFANKLMRPYINVLRGVQMSMQGYASKWDSTGDALRQWNYTPPRIQEAFQSMNPFSARWFPGKTSERIAKLNVFGGSLEQHQLAGPEYQAGLRQAPQDIFLSRKGVYASARTGEANPGASYYNYRAELVLDSPMAEYLYRAKEASFIYDKNVQKAAMDNTARRTVSAEALAIRRDQELRGFGILQNSLFGWASPMAFAWHVPVPGFPQGWAPKDQVAKYMERSRTGRGASFTDSIRSMAAGIAQGTSRWLQPHKMAMVVYCPKCGTANYRGSSCKNPSCKQVQY